MPEKRYIVGGMDGWLNVKREPSLILCRSGNGKTVGSVSVALSLFPVAGCNAQQMTPAARYLTESEAGNAAFVSRWLITNRSSANQKDAEWFLQQAVREQQNKNWSAATKAFGEA